MGNTAKGGHVRGQPDAALLRTITPCTHYKSHGGDITITDVQGTSLFVIENIIERRKIFTLRSRGYRKSSSSAYYLTIGAEGLDNVLRSSTDRDWCRCFVAIRNLTIKFM